MLGFIFLCTIYCNIFNVQLCLLPYFYKERKLLLQWIHLIIMLIELSVI